MGIHLAVCIPTFRNPSGLRALLESIKYQHFHKVTQPKIEIFVVDNDSEGSGKLVVESYQQELPYPLHYEIERQRGIPFVRNRLVKLAAHCDFIAFIDDDEEATPNWLDELLNIQSEFQAPIVTGPVLARFEAKPPAWAEDGRFYNTPRYPTGTKREMFHTHNLLIRSTLISQFEKPFEEAMALTGGTDTLFARRVEKLGIAAIWADDAVIYESISATRSTLQWYFRRRYRIGNAHVLYGRFLPRPRYRLEAVFAATLYLGQGLAIMLTSLWRGYHKAIQGVGYIFTAAGLLGGVLHINQKEYGNNYRQQW